MKLESRVWVLSKIENPPSPRLARVDLSGTLDPYSGQSPTIVVPLSETIVLLLLFEIGGWVLGVWEGVRGLSAPPNQALGQSWAPGVRGLVFFVKRNISYIVGHAISQL